MELVLSSSSSPWNSSFTDSSTGEVIYVSSSPFSLAGWSATLEKRLSPGMASTHGRINVHGHGTDIFPRRAVQRNCEYRSSRILVFNHFPLWACRENKTFLRRRMVRKVKSIASRNNQLFLNDDIVDLLSHAFTGADGRGYKWKLRSTKPEASFFSKYNN